jgi:putative oxidoreductase
MAFLARFEPHFYALMRIVTGFLFLFHGAEILFGIPVGTPGEAPAYVIYVAGPIELVGGILVMIGLFTRPAAFLCSGLMAVAYWLVHSHRALLPIQNAGEPAALYAFVFLYIAARGSGIWSADGGGRAA